MPDFDSSTFLRSTAGQLLDRLADIDPSGAPPSELGIGMRELSALSELERLGLVELERAAGAMSWKIERVRVTDAGRARVREGRTG